MLRKYSNRVQVPFSKNIAKKLEAAKEDVAAAFVRRALDIIVAGCKARGAVWGAGMVGGHCSQRSSAGCQMPSAAICCHPMGPPCCMTNSYPHPPSLRAALLLCRDVLQDLQAQELGDDYTFMLMVNNPVKLQAPHGDGYHMVDKEKKTDITTRKIARACQKFVCVKAKVPGEEGGVEVQTGMAVRGRGGQCLVISDDCTRVALMATPFGLSTLSGLEHWPVCNVLSLTLIVDIWRRKVKTD